MRAGATFVSLAKPNMDMSEKRNKHGIHRNLGNQRPSDCETTQPRIAASHGATMALAPSATRMAMD
jgi:hypothetical protein